MGSSYKKISKEIMQQSLAQESEALSDTLETLGKLVQELQVISRNDVSLSSVDRAKEALKLVPEYRNSLEKVTRLLKNRARTRVSEL